MITSKGMKWIWGAENILQNCIRAIEYASAVQSLEQDQWKFTRNCYIESAIVNWWKIFGSDRESTNYTKFFGDSIKLSTEMIHGFASADVLTRLVRASGLSVVEYDTFHTTAKKARNKFFAHYDLSAIPTLPDIEIMKQVCLEMRNILKEVVALEQLDPACDEEKIRMYNAIPQQRNNIDLVSGFANGVRNFGRPIQSRMSPYKQCVK